jgi:hypothetical protein
LRTAAAPRQRASCMRVVHQVTAEHKASHGHPGEDGDDQVESAVHTEENSKRPASTGAVVGGAEPACRGWGRYRSAWFGLSPGRRPP